MNGSTCQDIKVLPKLVCVPFPFNTFEPTRNCTCVNHENIIPGSGREFFCKYNLHTLISSLKILPVLLQKYVMPLFRNFWESRNPTFPPSPDHYLTHRDPVPPAIVKDDFIIAYFRFQVGRSVSLWWRSDLSWTPIFESWKKNIKREFCFFVLYCSLSSLIAQFIVHNICFHIEKVY